MINLEKLLPFAFESVVPDNRANSHWPSSASAMSSNGLESGVGGCLRSQYWRHLKVEKTNPPSGDNIVKMTLGRVAGDYVVESTKRLGIYAADEKRIWVPELKISGKVDILIYDGHDIIPVEVKSTYGYNGIKGVIKPLKGEEIHPRVDHSMQIFIYLDYYYRESKAGRIKHNFPYGLLFYIARDTGQRAQHVLRIHDTEKVEIFNGLKIPVTQRIINGVLDDSFTNIDIYKRWMLLDEYVEKKELPPREFIIQYSKLAAMKKVAELPKKKREDLQKDRQIELRDFQCSYCNYKNLCWKGISDNDLWEGVADINTKAKQ